MAAQFGVGGGIRKELLPAWLGTQPRLLPGPHPSGKIVPVPGWHHAEQSTEPVYVRADLKLDLRSVDDVKNLRRRLEQVRHANPGLWSDPGDQVSPYVPDDLPEGWTIEDVLQDFALLSPETVALQESWVNQLAFYRSPRAADSAGHPWSSSNHVSDWGIYLHSAGIESLARTIYLAVGFDHATAIGYAAADLVNHELQHAAFDLVALRLETVAGSALSIGNHACSPCRTEEAMCNASAVKAARARAESMAPSAASKFRAAAQRYEAWASNGPAGYRNWASYLPEQTWNDGVRDVLGHDGVPALVAGDLYRGASGSTSITDVPLWLIVDPGTAAEAGLWTLGL